MFYIDFSVIAPHTQLGLPNGKESELNSKNKQPNELAEYISTINQKKEEKHSLQNHSLALLSQQVVERGVLHYRIQNPTCPDSAPSMSFVETQSSQDKPFKQNPSEESDLREILKEFETFRQNPSEESDLREILKELEPFKQNPSEKSDLREILKEFELPKQDPAEESDAREVIKDFEKKDFPITTTKQCSYSLDVLNGTMHTLEQMNKSTRKRKREVDTTVASSTNYRYCCFCAERIKNFHRDPDLEDMGHFLCQQHFNSFTQVKRKLGNNVTKLEEIKQLIVRFPNHPTSYDEDSYEKIKVTEPSCLLILIYPDRFCCLCGDYVIASAKKREDAQGLLCQNHNPQFRSALNKKIDKAVIDKVFHARFTQPPHLMDPETVKHLKSSIPEDLVDECLRLQSEENAL